MDLSADSARRTSHASKDEGVALLTVLGVILILTLVAVGSYVLADQTLHQASTEADRTRAYRAASSGLDLYLSSLESAPSNGAVLTFPPFATGEGTATVSIAQNGASSNEFVVTSVGTGVDGTTATIRQELTSAGIWDMNVVTEVGSGWGLLEPAPLEPLNRRLNVIGTFYTEGDYTVRASTSILEGPLVINGGDLNVESGGRVGTADDPVNVLCTGSVPANTDPGDGAGVFVGTLSADAPGIPVPEYTWLDLLKAYSQASRESADNLIGESTTRNMETTYESPLYKTVVVSGSPESVGPLAMGRQPESLGGLAMVDAPEATVYSFGAWGPHTFGGVTIPGRKYPVTAVGIHDDWAYWNRKYDQPYDVLFINGTVYVDGSLEFRRPVRFIGNGTIVANGSVRILGGISAYGETPALAIQNGWSLGIVTPSFITIGASGGQFTQDQYTPAQLRAAMPTIWANLYSARGIQIAYYGDMLIRGAMVTPRLAVNADDVWLLSDSETRAFLPPMLPGEKTRLLLPGKWTLE